MQESEIYHEFLSSGAIQKGHFILSSGLHSDQYIQCAKLLMNPKKASIVANRLVEKILQSIEKNQIDIIVSPAMGGVILGYEVAKQLDYNAIFCERVEGQFVFRRNFIITPKTKVLLIEDVVTTAKSSLEVVDLLKTHRAEVIAEAALIDRSNGLANKKLPCKLIPLLTMNISSYTEDNLPEHLLNIPVSAPGSCFTKA